MAHGVKTLDLMIALFGRWSCRNGCGNSEMVREPGSFLALMSRMGVTSALAIAGGKGGAAAGGLAGSVFPGLGNAIGGVIGGLVGAASGAGTGMYLNRHLQPHMLNLALNITGLTNDDLFYYKNKTRIDEVAVGFQNTSRELTALPAW